MPISQNPKECGWFYHAPAKKDPSRSKVDYPAPSNIPGIGYDDPNSFDKEEVREMMFKETDSNYIRMAKMGGRKDLLSFNPDKYRSSKKGSSSAGYQRNDWFYLEDNRLEDEEKKEQEKKEWEFMLPEYMVHKNYKPSFQEDPSTTPTRTAAPYYTEANSVMHDEGRYATDKTVKIPEVRKPGYGVRNEKPPQAMQKPPPREKPVKPQESETLQGDRRTKAKFTMPNEKEDPTNMSKLLAGEYERDWYTKRAEMDKSLRGRGKSAGAERTQVMAGQQQQQRRDQPDAYMTSAQRRRMQEEEEKELFKLARFKNVPSKIDHHQRPEIMASVK